ncbi:MAG: hypothetical protein Q7U87_04105, partial [bacterium]|nr:hypothetical protein [bacterium]
MKEEKVDKYSFMGLMNCSSIEEVRERLSKWGSKLSAHEHLIRSSILDIHAHIEKVEKDILFEHMKELVTQYEKDEYE